VLAKIFKEKKGYTMEADIFAFGGLFSELYNNKPLKEIWQSDSTFRDAASRPDLRLWKKHVIKNDYRPPDPHDMNRKLRILLQKCWKKTPEKRPNAEDLRLQLSMGIQHKLLKNKDAREIWEEALRQHKVTGLHASPLTTHLGETWRVHTVRSRLAGKGSCAYGTDTK
jgi:hypothetical protein